MPSKFCLWGNVKKLPIELLSMLLGHISGKAAREILMAYSSSYTDNRYVWKENSKGGRWELVKIKYPVLLTLSGCVVASVVTAGTVMTCQC